MDGRHGARWMEWDELRCPELLTCTHLRKSSQRQIKAHGFAEGKNSAEQTQPNPFKANEKRPRQAPIEVLRRARRCAVDETNPSQVFRRGGILIDVRMLNDSIESIG